MCNWRELRALEMLNTSTYLPPGAGEAVWIHEAVVGALDDAAVGAAGTVTLGAFGDIRSV
jgi:hypothetical protein